MTAETRTAGLFDLAGKVAFVPGGYGGIGEAIVGGWRATARTLSIAGRDAAKADALAAKLRDDGLAASGCAMDARSVASIRAAVDGVVAEFGAIDLLVNCVGIQREQPLQEVTEEAWDDVIDVNLKAAMFPAQAVARHQVAAGRGGRQVHLLSVRA